MTKTILLSKDPDATLQTLSFDTAKLLDADDCYIARWDEDQRLATLTAATRKLEPNDASSDETVERSETKLVASILQSGHGLVLDDALNSADLSTEYAFLFGARSALGVPLIFGEHKLGSAIITFKAPHSFGPNEIEYAEQAGAQIALALWIFQQDLKVEQRLRENDRLAKISRALSESERIGSGEVLQLIVDSARELMPQAEKSVIHLLDIDEQVLIARAVSGFGEQEKEYTRVKMRLGEGVAGKVIREGVPVNLGDIKTSPYFISGDSLPTFRSLLVAPVQTGGRQIGAISVQSATAGAFSREDAELLNALAAQAAIALENTRLFETTQQRLREVNALYKTSQDMTSTLNTDQLLHNVVNLLQQNFGYYHAQVYLLDPASGDLVLKSGSGEIGARLLERGYRLSRGTGIVGHVAATAMPFFSNNVNDVLSFVRNPLLPDTQSELTVPIKVEGKVVGVLDIQQVPPRRFTDGDEQLIGAVADQLSVALQRANLYANLQTALQQEQTIRTQLIQSERLALVGRLLASVSHELNNPLQAIQNALFLLKEEESLSAQGKQDLNVILSEAERMAALMERLRSAYRPIRVRDFQPVQINDTVEDVRVLTATLMRHKEIAFEFLSAADLPVIPGISDQLRQVVLNLFLNAIEIMQPGGRLSVQTSDLPEAGEILLTVRDSGPGIGLEILPQIFEPFITSKDLGTGLGLTITHDIIEQHHGRIEAQNAPKGGAIFSVWLPYEQKP
jgi:signal transduction histidine kinase